MTAFGMKATLICYQDEYFNYKGIVEENGVDGNKDENGLAIGGYESAFCLDVGATYVYKMNEKILNKLRFAGTYRGNGLMIFRERLSHRQAIHWLRHFQIQVNKLVGSDYFQFTAEIWNPLQHNNLPTLETLEKTLPDEEWRKWKKKVKLVDKDAFPY